MHGAREYPQRLPHSNVGDATIRHGADVVLAELGHWEVVDGDPVGCGGVLPDPVRDLLVPQVLVVSDARVVYGRGDAIPLKLSVHFGAAFRSATPTRGEHDLGARLLDDFLEAHHAVLAEELVGASMVWVQHAIHVQEDDLLHRALVPRGRARLSLSRRSCCSSSPSHGDGVEYGGARPGDFLVNAQRRSSQAEAWSCGGTEGVRATHEARWTRLAQGWRGGAP